MLRNLIQVKIGHFRSMVQVRDRVFLIFCGRQHNSFHIFLEFLKNVKPIIVLKLNIFLYVFSCHLSLFKLLVTIVFEVPYDLDRLAYRENLLHERPEKDRA